MSQNMRLIEERVTYKSKLMITAMTWNITISSFYFGYCMVYLGTINISTLKTIYDISLSNDVASGLLNGCIPIGGLLGAISTSFLIARLSRRKCLLFINFFSFAVGMLIYIQYFPTLIFFRLCQGFCVGCNSTIAPLIVKQLSPVQISGTLGTFLQLNTSFGVATATLLAYILKKYTGDLTGMDFWYLIFGVTQATIVIQTLILIFVFPYQTPKYLLSIGKEQQAKRLIEIIYKPEYVDEILEEKKFDLLTSKNKERKIQIDTIMSENQEGQLVHKNNSTITTIVGIHLAIMQQFSGINAITVYGGKIASEAFLGEMVLLLPTLLNFQKFFAVFVTSYLLTRFGRKTIFTFGSLFLGIGNLLVMVGFFVRNNSLEVGQNLIISGLFMFMGIYGVSYGPMVWLYIPEIVQPKIIPYTTATNWIGASIVIILFPIITDELLGGHPGVLFIFFSFWCFGSLVFNQFFVLETKDKTQSTIIEEYSNLKICS